MRPKCAQKTKNGLVYPAICSPNGVRRLFITLVGYGCSIPDWATFTGIPLPDQPVGNKHKAKSERNAEIRVRYAVGEPLQEIAEAFGISPQRAHQIVKKQDHEIPL